MNAYQWMFLEEVSIAVSLLLVCIVLVVAVAINHETHKEDIKNKEEDSKY